LIRLAFFDPVLERIQEVEARMLRQSDNHHAELIAALRHLIGSGGKRIRVALTLLTGGMLQADPDRLVTLAAAIEMLHTATLVHDDLIDGSLMRRGRPTLNSRWSPAATVLTGDFIFARAAKLASDVESIVINQLFAETLGTIVNGEISQLFDKRVMINFAEYQKRIFAKTASLFETATKSAGLLSSLDENSIEQARQFGYGLGMAFQVVDDILDFTGDPSQVGKPVASDLRQGVITLPAIIYHQNHPEDALLPGIIIDDTGEDAILRLVDKIRNSGAIELAFEEAQKYIDLSLQALASFRDCQEKESLHDLALYILSRSK